MSTSMRNLGAVATITLLLSSTAAASAATNRIENRKTYGCSPTLRTRTSRRSTEPGQNCESIRGHFLGDWHPQIPCGLRFGRVGYGQAAFALQLRSERGELRLNVLLHLALADNLFPITTQEIVDRFHANPDGAGRFVLIEILKAEIRGAGLLDDAFNHAVNRRIVSTLEACNFESNEIGMPRRELGGPHLVVGAA